MGRVTIGRVTYKREDDRMSSTDELVANNAGYASGFDKGDLPLPPAKKLSLIHI